MRIKLNFTPGNADVLSSPIKQWLRDRGIFSDLYEIGYDFGKQFDKCIELVPVLIIDDGVLTDVDITEFVLRFGYDPS